MKHERYVRQLSKDEAQSLFDYRHGCLYWRHRSSGHRPDGRAIIPIKGKGRTSPYMTSVVRLGREIYQAHYLVWNWHNGITEHAIVFKDGDRLNCDIRNLQEVSAKKIIVSTSYQRPSALPEQNIVPQSYHHNCPMCSQPVATPTFDVIARKYELPPLQTKILKAIWSGNGHPVMPGKIFDAMYEDDIDGGPSDAEMYKAFKVGLCRLRARIEGSGVSIETVGYRGGYRLIMEGNN